MKNCRSCNNPVDAKFCGNCGQCIQIKRVDKHYIIHEIQHLLHFEKGILYTIKELIVSPGDNIRTFIREDRSRLVKPVLFIIITSLVYTFVNNLSEFEKAYINDSRIKGSATSIIFHWVQTHYGYANIIMGVCISWWLKVFYRKYDYNIFEVLILLCFVMGMGMLIFSVFAMLEGITKLRLMNVSSIVSIAYCTWAIGQFFNSKKVGSYLKALLSYVLGMITFFFLATLAGILIDAFVKH